MEVTKSVKQESRHFSDERFKEVWLQKIADRLTFKHWYFGHYHDDWDNGKYSMLYMDIIPLGYKVGE